MLEEYPYVCLWCMEAGKYKCEYCGEHWYWKCVKYGCACDAPSYEHPDDNWQFERFRKPE